MALVVVMIGRGGIRVAAAAVVVCSLVEIATQIVVGLWAQPWGCAGQRDETRFCCTASTCLFLTFSLARGASQVWPIETVRQSDGGGSKPYPPGINVGRV